MIQLKIRTEGSFGETYAPIESTVEYLASIGCTAAAIVDKQSTWFHVKWFNACKKHGIKPMLGVELVVSDIDDTSPAMWFVAKNLAGLQELYGWASKTYKQPLASKRGSIPALRWDDVRAMSSNIIKFAGDIVDAEFLKDIGAYADISPASRVLAMQKRSLGIPVVGVSDNAYAKIEDKDVFQFMGGGEKPSAQHILLELEGQDVARQISDSCEEYDLPKSPMIHAEGDLLAMCREGIAFRKLHWTKTYEDRLLHEIKMIREKQFDAYFIVVADMVVFAKKHMLVGPSRGSSAGSLVCYLLRITEIDPIPPKLMFERFIDVTRSDLPDIDLDFPDTKRHLVFEYMKQKYGAENVSNIGTISVYKPKSALVQVCKKLNIPPAATGAVKAAMIERSSADSRANNCLEDTLNLTDVGKALVASYPAIRAATQLEGHASHTGVHAAGLLVCNESITNYATVNDKGIAQIDKISAEELGLLKIDVLGLRTLGVLEDSGVPIDWYNLPFDDKKTYDLFNSQRLCGVFQFEGNAMRAVSQDITYNSIAEIDAVTALARPGPFAGGVTEEYIKRKNGKPYDAVHPAVEEYMAETFGLPVYQEQTLSIVKHVGNFSWDDTSKIRKAVSKRLGKEYFDAYWERFKAGSISNGLDEAAARKVWDTIYVMGSWQMNKCLESTTYVRLAMNGSNVPTWMTIEDLHKKYVSERSPWIKANNSMPRLLSLFPDGRGYSQKAVAIHKNGKKECVELNFSDGTKISCTASHKFIINGEWRTAGRAAIGSKFTILERQFQEYVKTGVSKNLNGRTKIAKAFRTKMLNEKCEDCGCEAKKRMEVHHNDNDAGEIRPNDLAWLCSGCHKNRHYADGSRKTNFNRGHRQSSVTLLSKKSVGLKETYDIEMPEHHNFVIDGGIVTHNSHTFSYAVISYWTAYLKANHPMEFAAANLRNAKDDDSALLLLREMTKEGLKYNPFDINKSEVNWCAKDGILYGGFMNLRGVGESKAAKLIEARNAGKLTTKMLEGITKAENSFSDIFPFRTKYKHLYEDAKSNNIGSELSLIEDLTEQIPHAEQRVFIGEVIYKNMRNYNEEVNVKKRGGKIGTGQLEFLDLRLRDDTGTIGARVGRQDYKRIGKDLMENVPVGATIMVRANFFNNIKFAFISKWKRIDGDTK